MIMDYQEDFFGIKVRGFCEKVISLVQLIDKKKVFEYELR